MVTFAFLSNLESSRSHSINAQITKSFLLNESGGLHSKISIYPTNKKNRFDWLSGSVVQHPLASVFYWLLPRLWIWDGSQTSTPLCLLLVLTCYRGRSLSTSPSLKMAHWGGYQQREPSGGFSIPAKGTGLMRVPHKRTIGRNVPRKEGNRNRPHYLTRRPVDRHFCLYTQKPWWTPV